ncbi:MAG TPA: SH3 domain-containing protein [Blastocatellia bacterium]|nr:SH3 domain-containing protein [Blastocatellia bacterium]
MSSILQHNGLLSLSSPARGLNDRQDNLTLGNIFVKKEQAYPILGGIAIGILVALVGVYLYNKGNMRFPQPNNPGPSSGGSDNIRFDDNNTNRPSKGTLLVRTNSVSLRNCPGLNCREIAALPMGTPVEELGENYFQNNMDWIKVRAGNREGWISRSFLE